jgi:hypothetical protein
VAESRSDLKKFDREGGMKVECLLSRMTVCMRIFRKNGVVCKIASVAAANRTFTGPNPTSMKAINQNTKLLTVIQTNRVRTSR